MNKETENMVILVEEQLAEGIGRPIRGHELVQRVDIGHIMHSTLYNMSESKVRKESRIDLPNQKYF